MAFTLRRLRQPENKQDFGLGHMQMTEQSPQPIERLKREVHHSLDSIEAQLTRLEILTAAMAAFSRPVPDYEAGFQHQRHLTASATVLRSAR